MLNSDNRPIPGQFQDLWVPADLLSSGLVQLENGDIIQRKPCDIREENTNGLSV